MPNQLSRKGGGDDQGADRAARGRNAPVLHVEHPWRNFIAQSNSVKIRQHLRPGERPKPGAEPGARAGLDIDTCIFCVSSSDVILSPAGEGSDMGYIPAMRAGLFWSKNAGVRHKARRAASIFPHLNSPGSAVSGATSAFIAAGTEYSCFPSIKARNH